MRVFLFLLFGIISLGSQAYAAGGVYQCIPCPAGIDCPAGTDEADIAEDMAAQDTSLGNPVGTIIALALDRGAEFGGYLLCNGQDIPAGTKYNALREFLAAPDENNVPTHPYGEGKVPNFQGMFLRGQGSQTLASGKSSANTVHSSGSTGEWQGDAIREISGSVANSVVYNSGGRGSGALYQHGNGTGSADAGSGSHFGGNTLDFYASRVVPTAAENRPVNYAVYYYIKY
jgi:hypothetical protein